ncbi:MAG TPA: LapA family protein [Hyphomicrobiales bacterium]|nr:LapA family protein [Hyphomicrobiales bacterium]
MLRLAAGLLWGVAALVLVLFAVANRGTVPVSIDPFAADPSLSARLPLFLLLFGAAALGIVVGGFADRLRSRRHARALRQEIRRRDEELARHRAATPPAPGLPAPR